MTILVRLLAAVAAVILFLLAIFLGEYSFNKILDFRKLERIPLTSVMGSTGGEVQLRGTAKIAASPLQAPRSQSHCLYYYYLIEEERTDSDGNRHWQTVHSERRLVDFLIADLSGEARVLSASDFGQVDWSVSMKYSKREGNRRYREWRLDPGDQVTLFGWMQKPGYEPQISFNHPGDYLPIVSQAGAAAERASLGFSAILLLAAAMALLIFACFGVISALAIHRVLVFLLLIAFSCTVFLLQFGSRSLESDIHAGYQRYTNQLQRSQALVAEFFQQHQLDADGTLAFDLNNQRFSTLSDSERQQLNSWRLAAWQVRARYLQQIDRFPENVYAALKGLDKPEAIPLPPDQQRVADALISSFEQTRTGQPWWLTLIGLVVTLGGALLSFMFIRVKRMQENLPTSKTTGVTYGITEVCGELIPEDDNALLTGPLSGRRCTWFRYVVREKRGSGKNSHWVTIEDRTGKQPFYCRDDEGQLRVFPTNAEIITRHSSSKHRGNRTYTEKRLEPRDNLYLLGKAVTDRTRGDTLVLRHEKGTPYIISNLSEREVMLRKAAAGMAFMSAAVSAMFFCLLLAYGSNGQFSSMDFILASLAAPVFLMVIMLIIMFNDLIFLKKRCARGWANIQVSLKKRADLVPRLQRVVERYISHEKSLLAHISELRTHQQGISNPSPEQGEQVKQYLAREHAFIDKLQVTLEQYPELKANRMMADMHRSLVKLENEIAMIRRGFNDAVTEYNTRIQKIPDNLLAKIFRFAPVSLLEFEQQVHQVPAAVPGNTDEPA